jgi:N-acetylneuraminic acid mutarotase
MVVWGGQNGFVTLFNDGGRYDPVTDSWKATDQTINVPTGRIDHTVVWTGSKMIVWGGNDDTTLTNTGGRYAP